MHVRQAVNRRKNHYYQSSKGHPCRPRRSQEVVEGPSEYVSGDLPNPVSSTTSLVWFQKAPRLSDAPLWET
jgi:hypothetical protein